MPPLEIRVIFERAGPLMICVTPSVGTDAEPGTIFWNTWYGPFYCDGGAGGSGTLRRDADCWEDYLPSFQVLVARHPVGIDIEPNSARNCINTGSKMLVKVAILSDDAFDARTVDPFTLTLLGATASSSRYGIEDVDGDGDLDMMVYFRGRDMVPDCGSPEATLTGATTTGMR